jgi:uncharacterized membrane protein
MRMATPAAPADQVRQLSQNLVSQHPRGEWANPGVEAALKRVVAGLDAGIENASPRVQARLRRLADELAGGVETLAPRVQEGLNRVAPDVVPPVTAPARAASRRTASGKAWLIAGVVAVAVTVGVATWLYFLRADDDARRTRGEDPDASATAQP